MTSDVSGALKAKSDAEDKLNTSYVKTQPEALVAKTAANNAALDAKNAAVAKSNSTYATYIDPIGYGVLII